MKVIFFFIFTVSLFAQDSSLVKMTITSNNFVKNNIKKSSLHLNNEVSAKTLHLNINSIRSWNRKIKTNFIISSAIIKQKKTKLSFIDSDLFLVIAGSAVILGATAAYFKLESDLYYDKYRETNNKSYLNKTNKYDIYSGIAFGTLQINFGYLIYKFLTD